MTNISLNKTEYIDSKVTSTAIDNDKKKDDKARPNIKNSLFLWRAFSESNTEIPPKKSKNGAIKNKEKNTTAMYALSTITSPVTLRMTSKDIQPSTLNISRPITLTNLTTTLNHKDGSPLHVNAVINNRVNFAIKSTGSCELLSRKGVSILNQPILKRTTSANKKTRISCIFNEYLPANTYKIKISITSKSKGLNENHKVTRAIPFSITPNDEQTMARNILNGADKTLLTPLLITPPSIHIPTNNTGKYHSRISVKNLSDKTLIIRPFFLEMPQNKSSRTLKIKPSRFILKPYKTKKISLISKHTDTPLFGKVLFSAKNYKNKRPASINYTVQDDTQPKAIIHFQTTPSIKQLDSKVEVFTAISNGAKQTLDGIDIQLLILNRKTKLRTQHETKRGKISLLPNEATDAYFQINPIDNGNYELTITVRHHGKIVTSNTQLLAIDEKNQRQNFTLINPDT